VKTSGTLEQDSGKVDEHHERKRDHDGPPPQHPEPLSPKKHAPCRRELGRAGAVATLHFLTAAERINPRICSHSPLLVAIGHVLHPVEMEESHGANMLSDKNTTAAPTSGRVTSPHSNNHRRHSNNVVCVGHIRLPGELSAHRWVGASTAFDTAASGDTAACITQMRWESWARPWGIHLCLECTAVCKWIRIPCSRRTTAPLHLL
jgi:hypothetical protein